MRIRKHASKLLPPTLSPPTTTPPRDHPSSLPQQQKPQQQQQQELEEQKQRQQQKQKKRTTHQKEVVCHLNRSPWDALPLPLLLLHLDDPDDFHFQRPAAAQPLQETTGGARQHDGAVAVEAPKVAVDATANFAGAARRSAVPRLLQAAKKKKNGGQYNSNDDDDGNDNNSKRRKQQAKKAVANIDIEVAEEAEKQRDAVAVCKKSDGKGWNCKREAKRPYSLCEYHLSQIRSYYHGNHHHHHLQPHAKPKGRVPEDGGNANKKQKNGGAAAAKPRRVRTSTDTGPEFYYYYSGFGPWRGKKRGVSVKKEDDVDGGSITSNHHPSPSTHLADAKEPREGAEGGGGDEDGGTGLDPESIDDVDESSDDYAGPSLVSRRRARKPVKARSLKSLL